MWQLIKETVTDWSEDKASRLAAALSFYSMLSFAPLLMVVLAVAGFFFGDEAVRGRLAQEISGLTGIQSGTLVEDVVANASQDQGQGLVATILGVVMLLVGASGVFGQLQDALNTIWEVEPPKRGILGTIKARFLSLTMVLGTAFLLTISLVTSAALSALGSGLGAVGHILFSLVVFTGLFAMMFKLLPDVEIQWRDVWIGALVTAVLFTVGKWAIGLYLGHSAIASTYGAAGALVVMLVWLFYSAQIFFLGAEFTQVYARRYGSRIKPVPGARPMTEEARAQQGMKPSPA